tara:strand:+ start:5 stop:352 length:348 start_codon:yes stop_codon:yes gene_type:complete
MYSGMMQDPNQQGLGGLLQQSQPQAGGTPWVSNKGRDYGQPYSQQLEGLFNQMPFLRALFGQAEVDPYANFNFSRDFGQPTQPTQYSEHMQHSGHPQSAGGLIDYNPNPPQEEIR